jgi:hypothetical protein
MATLSGGQIIAGNALTATATPGIPGTVVIGGARHNMLSQWSQPTSATLLRIPLSVGKAAVYTATFTVLSSPHYLRVDFYGWTPGTVTFTGLTTGGQPLPVAVAMGSFNLTGNSQGTVTLVSPSKISIDGPVAQRRTASFTTLKLVFLPEPGTLLLVGAGALALLCFGRRS